MELKKALELQVQYYGSDGSVKVDENGYICLNDLAAFFPQKRIQNWIDNASTKELIQKVDELLIHSISSELKSMITKRGRYKSGTYAHELVAMDFAAWLSVEFKLTIYQAFINGTQKKQDWNIKRILAAHNYKIMCEAVKNAHEPAKPYHYSNESLMINEIVFGIRDGNVRDNASEEQLDTVTMLEQDNATMIKLGINYQDRKKHLQAIFEDHKTKKLVAS